MANIELFDEFVATILSYLYIKFPLESALDARELSGDKETDEYGTVLDNNKVRSMRFTICLATMEWLIETGYIRIKDKGQYGYGRAVLTSKGLEVLKSTPESISKNESIGDKLVKLMNEGSLQMAKEVAKAAVSFGIKIF
ncbi:MAG: hypothetical protein Q9M50_14210 [Methylococcales bacterium]|nr:hypothetical protein [Methylococcales bacterium]